MVLQGLISALIGAIAWSGSVWTIPLSLVIPALVFSQTNRRSAAAVAITYYAAASWPLMASARAFWSLPWTSPLPPFAWVSAAMLLSLPWITLWSANRKEAVWRSPLALVIGALPPLGIIGWASPLTAAGVLFPGTSWLGLLAAIAADRVRTGAVVLALIANVLATSPIQPREWEPVNTAIETARRSDPLIDFEAVEQVRTRALRSSSRFVLAPESTVHHWTEATADFWQSTASELRSQGRTLFLGTTIANPGAAEYRNVLLAIGAESTTFVQRNPVPFAMWKPFGPKDGTHLRFTGRSTLDIGGHRAAILICYEQLLVWPILQSALERPTILLGIANDYWCRGTRVPAIQQACLRAWARLFGLPMVAAVNQ